MKKFFTLFVAVLLSSGAFAQSDWKDLVVNGNMEGVADPLWSSFWCHDYREGVEFDPESGQHDGLPFGGSGRPGLGLPKAWVVRINPKLCK